MENAKFVVKDKDTQTALDFIFANSIGNILLPNSAPTNNTMKANTMSYYNGFIYIKLGNGTTKRFAVTDVS